MDEKMETDALDRGPSGDFCAADNKEGVESFEHPSIKGDRNVKWEAVKFPEKEPSRPSEAAQKVEVQANLFRIDVSKMGKVYKYRLDLIKVTSDNKEKDLTKGPKSDYCKQARARVLQSVFADLLSFSKKQGTPLVDDKYDILYDGGHLCFAAHKLSIPESGVTFELLKEHIGSSNTTSYLGPKFEKLRATLQFVEEFDSSLTLAEDTRVVQQFLEVLTSAAAVTGRDHLLFANKTYPKSSSKDCSIGEGKVVKAGNEKNCRIVNADNGVAAMLQLDAKKSPFFTANSLIRLVPDLIGSRDLVLGARELEKLKTQLKDEWVRTTHLPRPRGFAVATVTSKSARQQTFPKDGRDITVYDYYLEHFKRKLAYPDAPLVVERKAKSLSYHPLEVLDLERGQRVHMQKSTPNMAEKMIRECQLKPCDLKAYIDEQLKEMTLDHDNKYLKAFGIHISARPEIAEARILHPPAIKYGSGNTEPQKDGLLQWKLNPRDKFLNPASLTGKSVFIIFDRCCRREQVESFLMSLERVARDHSMNVDFRKTSIVEMSSELDSELARRFQKSHDEGVKAIFAVTKMKLDPVHNSLKKYEADFGIVTQHISLQTLNKATGNQGAFMVLGNLISKTNPKLGGVNHEMTVSQAFQRVNSSDRNCSDRLFPKSRMFVGLDVSHAGPQSFADRQLGVEQSEPTVVGMSYSVGQSTRMQGSYWYQQPRLATITDLKKHMKSALTDWYNATKSLPEDIFVFRGGVSEGEFGKVVAELKELAMAFAFFDEKTRQGKYLPTLTCLVVQTNSNYRIIPTKINARDRPMDQNVKPGTCVDDQITSPAYNEFILVPQKALQGTARPIRCTLVYREKGVVGNMLSIDDIELLTNALCYGHQVVAGSTGQPCHLYAATNLSKRGRNNWKTANFADSDNRSSSSGLSSGGNFIHDGSPDFFERLSDKLGSSVKTHYWA